MGGRKGEGKWARKGMEGEGKGRKKKLRNGRKEREGEWAGVGEGKKLGRE